MRSISLLFGLIVVSSTVVLTAHCCHVKFQSIKDEFDAHWFGSFEIADQMRNNRAVYRNKVGLDEYFLFHSQSQERARWIIGKQQHLDESHPEGIAFVWSWAVTPAYIDEASSNSLWELPGDQGSNSTTIKGIGLSCHGSRDQTVFLNSRVLYLNGFYVQTGLMLDGRPVFVKAGGYGTKSLYLYYRVHGSWIVSSKLDSFTALARIKTKAPMPSAIKPGSQWSIKTPSGWVVDPDTYLIPPPPQHSRSTFKEVQRVRSMTRGPHFIMNNDVPIPLIGLGTGAIMDIASAVTSALDVGYSLFDTGENYGNNEEMGEVFTRVREKHPRGSYWITTKVCSSNLGFEHTLKSVRESLVNLRTSYVNLYLIHWPDCIQTEYQDCAEVEARGGNWTSTWSALEKLYAEGILVSIGLSNWDESRLQQLMQIATTIPHAIQNLHNMLEQDLGLLQLCRSLGIFFQAYGSLRNAFDDFFQKELMEPSEVDEYSTLMKYVRKIALQVGKSASQVILRWQVQNDIGVIPRATKLMDKFDEFAFVPPDPDTLVDDLSESETESSTLEDAEADTKPVDEDYYSQASVMADTDYYLRDEL